MSKLKSALAQDRPSEKRTFPIEQQVRYRCMEQSRASATGAGRTLEISSREVRFTTEHVLKRGERVRVAVDWPAMLDNCCLIKLDIRGSVVRSSPQSATVKIERYEFRTRAPLRVMHAGAAGA
ncbi:MAG TPA: hypothetical protein VMT86_20955 [Bryobacteraceae bacterium]|nr:hypothetical protein [Bryobacteraceae bacterium]